MHKTLFGDLAKKNSRSLRRYNLGKIGVHEHACMVGAESERILRETRKVLENGGIKMKLESLPNPYGDGKASQKIVKDLKGRFHSRKLAIKSGRTVPFNV